MCLVSECAALPAALRSFPRLQKEGAPFWCSRKSGSSCGRGNARRTRARTLFGHPRREYGGRSSPRTARKGGGGAAAGRADARGFGRRALAPERSLHARPRAPYEIRPLSIAPAAACAVFALLLAAAFFTFSPVGPGGLLKGLIEALIAQIKEALQTHIPSPVLCSFVGRGSSGAWAAFCAFCRRSACSFSFDAARRERALIPSCLLYGRHSFARWAERAGSLFPSDGLRLYGGCHPLDARPRRQKDAAPRHFVPSLSLVQRKAPRLSHARFFLFQDPFLAALLLYVLGAGLSFAVLLFLGGEKGAPFVLEFALPAFPEAQTVAKPCVFSSNSL